jgi:cation diffusion facilitator CzcD-associated flavoprotein CzcO
MSGEQRTPTVILGAGPAGLAVAACLERQGEAYVLLERSDHVGAAWRRHYARLHLHTHKRFSALPYLPFPAGTPSYPARQQVVDYLEAYAARWSLRPRFGQAVASVRRRGGQWETETQDARYVSRRVVVATGYCRVPHVPAWPGQSAFRGEILHSSAYQNGEPYRGQRVLVVGMGNSGGEIAIDLWEHGAQPALAVRSPLVVIPRDLLGIPILAIALALRRLPAGVADALTAPILRLVFGDLTRLGLRRAAVGPFRLIERQARIPLIDVGTLGLIGQGKIALRPGVAGFSSAGVRFRDGSEQAFDAVVLATGYRPEVGAFLEAASAVTDVKGDPVASGRESAEAGLYFCGFYVAPTGMLREIALEARRIARDIAGDPRR